MFEDHTSEILEGLREPTWKVPNVEQIHEAVKAANHDQYMQMYGVKVRVLKGEEAEEHQHLIWAVGKLKETYLPKDIVDGILRTEMHSSWTISSLPKV